jgi:hypothetical protein
VGPVVIAHVERLADLLTIFCDLFLRFAKRFCHEVMRLHRTDRKVQMVLGNLERVKWEILRFVRDTILYLTKAT